MNFVSCDWQKKKITGEKRGRDYDKVPTRVERKVRRISRTTQKQTSGKAITKMSLKTGTKRLELVSVSKQVGTHTYRKFRIRDLVGKGGVFWTTSTNLQSDYRVCIQHGRHTIYELYLNLLTHRTYILNLPRVKDDTHTHTHIEIIRRLNNDLIRISLKQNVPVMERRKKDNSKIIQ